MELALEIKDLCKTYHSGVEAIKSISLTVEQGEFLALLGPNGAGKSTTIGIISSLVNKTSGSVKVFGYDLDTELAKAKSCIGLVPQEFNFNQFEKVFDIVVNQAGFYGVAKEVALVNAEKCLKQLDLWDKRYAVSRTLSGGMKRRLMIARALVHEPKLLILDEPTTGVDIELRRSTWDFLRNLNEQGITIVLTTHYLEEAEYLCRTIGIVDKGKIITSTTVKDILEKLRKYTVILELSEPTHFNLDNDDYDIKLLDEKTVECTYTKEQGLNELFNIMNEKGINISNIRNKSNRLEQLFLELVNS